MEKRYFISASATMCLGCIGICWTQAFAGTNLKQAKNILNRYRKESKLHEDTKHIQFFITELWENEKFYEMLSKTPKPEYAKQLDY